MVRISLFSRYQGSAAEDQVLKEHWNSLNLPEEYNVRWLKSVDFKKGYSQLKSGTSTSTCQDLPSDVIFEASDELHFKRLFKGTFPMRSNDLKMLVITHKDTVIASGVLLEVDGDKTST